MGIGDDDDVDQLFLFCQPVQPSPVLPQVVIKRPQEMQGETLILFAWFCRTGREEGGGRDIVIHCKGVLVLETEINN